VREYLKILQGKIWVERLPGYAPELNPVEYHWGHWKQHELPICSPAISGNSPAGPPMPLRRIRRKRSRLICAFWHKAEL